MWNVQQGLCHSLSLRQLGTFIRGWERRAELIPPSSYNNGLSRTQMTVLLTHTLVGKRALRAVQKKQNSLTIMFGFE